MELSTVELKILVHKQGLKPLQKLLLILLTDGGAPKPPRLIKQIAASVGLGAAKTWNVTEIFKRSKGLAISVPGGWELSANGMTHLTDLGLVGDVHIGQPAAQLRALLPKITSMDARAFVAEAVSSYETKCYRAATVLSWVGAVAILYDHIFAKHLAAFNQELTRRFPKHKPVSAIEDFTEIKEFDFLDIAQAISVVGKSVKSELKARLTLRNGCGHPNKLAIGAHMVAAHLESSHRQRLHKILRRT